MTLALVDCPTGLAGDMLLAALFDLGLEQGVIEQPLAALGLAGSYRIEHSEGRSGGLRGRRLQVRSLEPQPAHRHWRDLRRLLGEAPLEQPLRQRLLAVFGLLAEAEAAVHGHPPEQVHFHEVGALDALVDIVGVCAGLLHFGIERLVCGVPPAGHGHVDTAHGRLPLPAPAVLEIARRCRIPLAGSGGFPPGELTTPTGLALMACWAECFEPPPSAVPERVGVGLGSRELDRPNLLRLTLASPWAPAQLDGPFAVEPAGPQPGAAERLETVVQQQCQIDDASAEDLAFLAEELRRAGALEVFSQPIAMKKGRSAVLLTALVTPQAAGPLRAVWWRHGTSLGLRETPQARWVLERRSRRVATPLGEVGLKRAGLPGDGFRVTIEHDDLAALSRHHGLPLAEMRQRLRQALLAMGDPWFPTTEAGGNGAAVPASAPPAAAPPAQPSAPPPTP